MTEPKVSVVIVPRERFGVAERTLDALYQHGGCPFELVYVDGGAPPALAARLRERAARDGFTLIRRDHYLTPNQARNLGWRAARRDYVVFLDNDVIGRDGWLARLVARAEAGDAVAVSPVICEGPPLHTYVHCAGGDCTLVPGAAPAKRHLLVHMFHFGHRLEAVARTLAAGPTGLIEFHCVLLRRDFLEAIGGLDEAMMATHEEMDVSLQIAERGETIALEPDSVVTYMVREPIARGDADYYLLRWSDVWLQSSLDHLMAKWSFEPDPFLSRYYRLSNRWRRNQVFAPRVARLLPRERAPEALRRAALALLMVGERAHNRRVVARWRAATGHREDASGPPAR